MLRLVDVYPFRIIRPLPFRFRTSFGIREYISHVMVRMEWITETGQTIRSFGESTTHSEPYFNGEFDLTALAYIGRIGNLLVKKREYAAPEDLHHLLETLSLNKNNRFAIAALDIAYHDAFAKAAGLPMTEYLIRHYAYPCTAPLKEIVSGISWGIKESPEKLAQKVRESVHRGVSKIKLKIRPGQDLEVIRAAKSVLEGHDIRLSVDANSSYDPDNPEHRRILKDIGTLVEVIEQPFFYNDLWHHAGFQAELLSEGIGVTVCLDESILQLRSVTDWTEQLSLITGRSLSDIAKSMMVNMKLSRVGGLGPAMEIAKYCKSAGIRIMPGAMHEFTIGQAALVDFAAIDEAFYPGDIQGEEIYYTVPITRLDGEPHRLLSTNAHGKVAVPSGTGLGVGDIDFSILDRVAPNTYLVRDDADSGRWQPEWHPGLLDVVLADVKHQCTDIGFHSPFVLKGSS